MTDNNYSNLKSLLDNAKIRFTYFMEDPNPENMYNQSQKAFSIDFNGYNSEFDFKNALIKAYDNFIYDSIISCLKEDLILKGNLLSELSHIKQQIEEQDNSKKYLKHFHSDVQLSKKSTIIITSDSFGNLGERSRIENFVKLQLKYLQKTCDFISSINDKNTKENKSCSAKESSMLMHYIFSELKLFDKYKEKATLINFMTGKDTDNIRKAFSNVVKADVNDMSREHKKSLRKVLGLFKDLEIESIIKAIESDLEIKK